MKQLLKRKELLMGFLIAMLLTACAAGVTIGAACEVYRDHRLLMPDITGASRAFLEWFDVLDASMLSVCKRG
jgi:hypothetical protein